MFKEGGFSLFQTLFMKWDFINIFYIALFQIRIKGDRTVQVCYMLLCVYCVIWLALL
jgi:hypothetical protein